MSHRTLNELLQSAHKDPDNDHSQQSDADRADLRLRRWIDETNALLKSMASTPESYGINRTAQQVMALGSFRTHMMLGLQALKASQS